MKTKTCFGLILMMTAGVLTAAETKEPWQFEATPYFWFLGIDGNATIDGITGDVDLSFSDIFDNFNYGGAVRLDAMKGKWGLKSDTLMIDLGSDFNGPFGNRAEVDLRQWAADFAVSYEIFSKPMDESSNRKLTLSPYAGFRYNYLKQKVSLPGPIGTVGDSQDWVDLLVGVQVKVDLTEKLSANFEGDVGGFEIGSSSDLAWQVIAGFNYVLSEKVDFKFGYRHFDLDYNRGSGSNEFGIDAAYSGPFTGLTIKW